MQDLWLFLWKSRQIRSDSGGRSSAKKGGLQSGRLAGKGRSSVSLSVGRMARDSEVVGRLTPIDPAAVVSETENPSQTLLEKSAILNAIVARGAVIATKILLGRTLGLASEQFRRGRGQ